MVLKDLLNEGIDILNKAKIDAPLVSAREILCHVIKRDKVFLFAHPDFVLDIYQINEFNHLIRLRAEGMPLQYITGHQEFMSLDFITIPGVLIPRQDTETLVESVIEYSNGHFNDKFRILDIGAGSGCIAISLAYYLKNSYVTSVDISDIAIKTASLNAEKNGVSHRVKFVRSDLFSEIGDGIFDIIVSNPPYIPKNEIDGLQREVSAYEPELALAGGVDGLFYYKKIIAEIEKYLVCDGLLAFEAGIGQSTQLMEMMKNKFYNIRAVKDISQVERVVLGRLK